MGAAKVPPAVYKETYKGIGFTLTAAGVWMFDRSPPVRPYWWSQFIAPEDCGLFAYCDYESNDARIHARFTQAHIAAMRRAIDKVDARRNKRGAL